MSVTIQVGQSAQRPIIYRPPSETPGPSYAASNQSNGAERTAHSRPDALGSISSDRLQVSQLNIQHASIQELLQATHSKPQV